MGKAQKGPSVIRRVVALALVVLCVAIVGVVGALRHAKASSTTVRSPNAVVVPTTLPYSARPGANGTKILTEAVDPLTLSVPESWKSPPAVPLTLHDEINGLAQDAPALQGLLQAEAKVAGKSAIRLFAYQPVAPHALVWVTSFSAPGTKDLTADGVDALATAVRRRSTNLTVTGVQLPVGSVLKLDSSLVVDKQAVAVETLILTSGGRFLLVEMVSETNSAGVPAIFDQIAQSLRLG
jgi:hypothetical protein